MKKGLFNKISAIVLVIIVMLSMTACKPEEIDYLIMKTAVGNSPYTEGFGLKIDINPIEISYSNFVIQWKVSSGTIYSFDSKNNYIDITDTIEGAHITYFSDNFGSVVWVPDEDNNEAVILDVYLYKDYDAASPFAHDSAEIILINDEYAIQ